MAEIEKAKEEEEEVKEEEVPKKTLKQRLKENWQVGIKLLEIILCVVCLCFLFEPAKMTGLGKTHLHHVGIAYTSITGYILINCAFLVGRYLGERLPYKISVIFSICGGCLFVLTGILLVADRSHLIKDYFFHPHTYLMTMLTTATFLAFANALVFVVDSVLTFRRQSDL